MSLVGPSWTAEILFSARRLSADEARHVGLVNRVVPVDELEPAVRDLAATIAANAPLTVQACKAAIREARRDPAHRDLDAVDAHGRGVLPLGGLPRRSGRLRREAPAPVPGSADADQGRACARARAEGVPRVARRRGAAEPRRADVLLQGQEVVPDVPRRPPRRRSPRDLVPRADGGAGPGRARGADAGSSCPRTSATADGSACASTSTSTGTRSPTSCATRTAWSRPKTVVDALRRSR